jgi:ATP-dependent Clp protease ATP-binding subunit ClpA
MFERFSGGARRAVVTSETLAHRFRQPTIAPAHLLLGAFQAGDSAMTALLDQLGADSSEISTGISAICRIGSTDTTEKIPFQDHTKTMIIEAVKTAQTLRSEQIETPHLLLALLHLDRGELSPVLAEQGLTTDSVTATLGGAPDGRVTFQVRTSKGTGRFRRNGKLS